MAHITHMTDKPATVDDLEFYTLQEVAARLRVSKVTVLAWIDSGTLLAHRFGDKTIRIQNIDYNAFVDLSRVKCSTGR